MAQTPPNPPSAWRLYAPVLLPLALVLLILGVWTGTAPQPGEMVWLAVLTAQSVIRAPRAAAARANTVTDSRRDGTETLLLGLAFCGMMVLPLLAIVTPLLDVAAYRPPGWFLLPGAALGLAGLWLFHRSHADLGRHWSVTVELHAAQQLVTSGVYARIRHPMYAAIWLLAAAQALLVGNWIAAPAALLAFAPMYASRMRREEAMMAERFGTAWAGYARRTGRVLPRWTT